MAFRGGLLEFRVWGDPCLSPRLETVSPASLEGLGRSRVEG